LSRDHSRGRVFGLSTASHAIRSRQPALALGLLETDEEYEICLRAAGLMQRGSRQLLHLLSIILLQCSLTNPLKLWDSHFNNLSDDRTFRDIRKDDRPFGDVTIVFSCEFPFVISFFRYFQ
jgi:hypothetical protein